MIDQKSIRVASVQLNSGSDQISNLERTSALLEGCAEQNFDMVLLPENFSFMGGSDIEKLAIAEKQSSSSVLAYLSNLARKYETVIVGGTIPLKGSSSKKIRNSCPVLSPAGEIIACYDKMHLFDVTISDEEYRESNTAEAGMKPETASFDGWKIGLSICYDLRFPELYRHYSAVGCNILTVPAAFTPPTGKAHWQTLLRARAIENQSYVLAAAQCGTHPDGRQTWGHSMIISPWGEVLNELDEDEGIITAEISLNNLNEIRQAMPVLNHRRI
ncbi:MAG: carbon-nitrogen hydrolase family protein [Mariprofundaceae bacterium]